MGNNTGAYNHHWDGSILIDLMARTGITTRYFAEKSGLSLSSINNYRSNKTAPGVDTLVIIANFFNVPLDYLCGRYSEDDAKAFIAEYPQYFEKLRKKDYEDFLEKKAEYRNKDNSWEAPYPYNLLDDIFCASYDHIASDDEIDALHAMIETLHPKEQICLNEYYENGKSLDEIGIMLNVTAERIRQIIAKGLRKLRHPSRRKTIENGLKYNAAKIDYFAKLKEVDNREQILAYKEEAFNKKLQDYKDKVKPDFDDFVAIRMAQNDPDILDTPIEELNLSVRAFNALKRAKINTLGAIIERYSKGNDQDGLIYVNNLGRKSIDDIIEQCYKVLGVDIRLMCKNKEKEN